MNEVRDLCLLLCQAESVVSSLSLLSKLYLLGYMLFLIPSLRFYTQ